MTYRVEQDKSPRADLDKYNYLIYRGTELVARYWHDYRGDDHGIEFCNGKSEIGPLGRMTDFIQGGGPQTLTLSDRAIAYLNEHTRANPGAPGA